MLFRSKRLSFRLLEQGDLEELFNHVWGNAETMEYCGGAVTKEKISRIIEHSRSQYHTYGNTVFAVTKNGQLLGVCGGEPDGDDPASAELIVHLAIEYRQKGYGTEALQTYVKWLAEGKGAAFIYASAHPDNQASLNMIKKCGLISSGFRQYEDTGFVNEPYFELVLG